MKRILLLLAIMGMASCAAESFIRQTQVGDGFNLVRRVDWAAAKRVIVPVDSPIGLYVAGWKLAEFPKEATEVSSNYVSILSNALFDRADDYNALLIVFDQALEDIEKNPEYIKAREAANAIIKQAQDRVEELSNQFEDLDQKYGLQQKKREYVEAFVQVAPQLPEFKAFKDAWGNYKKECLQQAIASQKDFEKMVQEELAKKKIQLKDPVEKDMIGARLGLNIGSICLTQLYTKDLAPILDVLSKEQLGGGFFPYLSRFNPSSSECSLLKEECFNLYEKFENACKSDPKVAKAFRAYQDTATKMRQELISIRKSNVYIAMAEERLAGIGRYLLIMKNIVDRMMKEKGVWQKIQEFRKKFPADIIKTQADFDASMNKILDQEEAKIKKILDERKSQKVVSVKTA